MLKRSIFPLTVAVVAAVAAMVGLETMQESPDQPLAEPGFDAFAEGVDLRFHHDSGRLGYAMQAERQIRFDDNEIEWRRPSLQWFAGDGGADWQVEAERGVSPAGGELLKLTGNVLLRRDPVDNSGPLELTTSTLDIDLVDEVVSTGARVEMVAGAVRQNAAGLVLTLPEDNLQMLGDIKGSYARDSHAQP